MNKFAKDMLMAKYGKRESQQDYDRNRGDMDRDYERGYDRTDGRDYDRGNGDYRRDYADYNRDGRRGGDRDRDRDRDQDRYRRDYDRDYDRDYRRDRADRNYDEDYGETQYGKMSRKDIEKWKKSFKNDDGSHGEHYKKDQIEPVVKRLGIDVERFGGSDIFCLAVNMMYADYCKVAKKYGCNHVEFYVDMAKAFFDDKDFMGEPEEKLWLYYKCIAESEE